MKCLQPKLFVSYYFSSRLGTNIQIKTNILFGLWLHCLYVCYIKQNHLYYTSIWIFEGVMSGKCIVGIYSYGNKKSVTGSGYFRFKALAIYKFRGIIEIVLSNFFQFFSNLPTNVVKLSVSTIIYYNV